MEVLLRTFQDTGKLDFETFKQVWKQLRFGEIQHLPEIFCATKVSKYSKVQLQQLERQHLQETYQLFIRIIVKPCVPQERIGSLYGLFCMYRTQNFQPRIPIKISPKVFRFVCDQAIADENHFESVQSRRILAILLQENSFLFCSSDGFGTDSYFECIHSPDGSPDTATSTDKDLYNEIITKFDQKSVALRRTIQSSLELVQRTKGQTPTEKITSSDFFQGVLKLLQNRSKKRDFHLKFKEQNVSGAVKKPKLLHLNRPPKHHSTEKKPWICRKEKEVTRMLLPEVKKLTQIKEVNNFHSTQNNGTEISDSDDSYMDSVVESLELKIKELKSKSTKPSSSRKSKVLESLNASINIENENSGDCLPASKQNINQMKRNKKSTGNPNEKRKEKSIRNSSEKRNEKPIRNAIEKRNEKSNEKVREKPNEESNGRTKGKPKEKQKQNSAEQSSDEDSLVDSVFESGAALLSLLR
mmetsp:Transcript_541/g.820  ORF Transcript_541/g.820 Transcript_541/m.820 type:complete len:470 (+) Transcript_541:111-1520(+)